MNKIVSVHSSLKKNHRFITAMIIEKMEQKGFLDLRASFIDILLVVIEADEGRSIKEIGKSCALKKQTMTTHINELLNRGYIQKIRNKKDKRSQFITLSDYGLKFQLAIKDVMLDIEEELESQLGTIELESIDTSLSNMYSKMIKNNQ